VSSNLNTSIKHKVFMLMLISLISTALVFSVLEKRDTRITDVKILFDNSLGKSLISKNEVISILDNHVGHSLVSSRIKDLPFDQFEKVLEKDTRIYEAQVYVNKFSRIVVKINPSQPIVRLRPKSGKGYYLDQYGTRIKLSKRLTARVPVATGNIAAYTDDFKEVDKKSSLYFVYDLAKRLYDDPQFLSPLVEQINVDEQNAITLVPKVGREKIYFGKHENMEDKFYKLSEFYRTGLPKEGWNKYKELRLDIKDQVVGLK